MFRKNLKKTETNLKVIRHLLKNGIKRIRHNSTNVRHMETPIGNFNKFVRVQ